MAEEYPQFGATAILRALEAPSTDSAEYFKGFEDRFGGPPDERGLTDRLLYGIFQQLKPKPDPNSKDKPLPDSHFGINLISYATHDETENGCDYCFKFTINRLHKGEVVTEKREIYIQAKSWKNDKDCDFAAKNSAGTLQMKLVDDFVKANQKSGVIVYGGYITYSRQGVNFFPLEEVKAAYNHFNPTPDKKPIPPYKKNMSDYFLQKRNDRNTMDYSMAKMLGIMDG